MDYGIFLLPLSASFILSTLLLIALIFFGKKVKKNNSRTSIRHIHNYEISRFGGIALIFSFIAVAIFDQKLVISSPLAGVLFGSVMILILGLVDDMKEISWKTQLFFQLLIVISVYIAGVKLEYITNPFGGILLFQSGVGYVIGFLISIVWVIFFINIINWVDGVDGVAGGVTLIGALTVFFLSLRPEVNQPPIGIISAIIIGCLIGFVIFNFYPAKILAGTSGAMFMGFILAIMAIFAGAKIATTMLVLAIPVIDAFWVVWQRFKAGDSIFSPDRRHLHFKLLELGWSVKKICLFYYVITACVAIVALNTHAFGKIVAFLFLIVIFFCIFLFINKKAIEKI